MRIFLLAVLGFSFAVSSCGRPAPVVPVKPVITEHMKGDAMLVFSETHSWRHNEGIAGAGKALVELAQDMGYAVYSTEQSAFFNAEDLARFKLVVFNNVTGEALTKQEQGVFETWFANGGALVAIHGSGDRAERNWDWFRDDVIGSKFTAHPADPQFQTARVQSLAPQHPVMAGLPDSFELNEEWYSFEKPAQDHGMLPIAGLDETSYRPRNDVYGDYQDLRMDLNGDGPIAHPVIWSKCHEGDARPRSVYMALGHQVGTFDKDTSQGIARKILANALHWSVKNTGKNDEGCGG